MDSSMNGLKNKKEIEVKISNIDKQVWLIYKNGTYLMYRTPWVWTYTYTHKTTNTIEITHISITYKSFLASFCACVIQTLNMRPTLSVIFKCTVHYCELCCTHSSLRVHYVVQQISGAYSSCITDALWLLNSSPFLSYHRLWNTSL